MSYRPHIRMSTAGQKSYEPVYPNLFEVRLIPPAALRSNESWKDVDLILQNVKTISGVGSTDKSLNTVTQTFKGAKRTYTDGFVADSTAKITLSFELNLNDKNEIYVYNALREWRNLCYNPLTGEMSPKKVYAGTGDDPAMLSTILYDKSDNVYMQRNFYLVFPTTEIKPIETLDYDSKQIATINGITFVADYFDDIINGMV